MSLLADVEEIAIVELRSESGLPSPPLHRHRDHVESFYVVGGELSFTIGDREISAGEGTWLQVPAGTPHTFAAVDGASAHLLDIHTPARGFGAFMRALITTGNSEAAVAESGFDQESV